jgi:large subunit ribosomal protein L10
MPKSIQEKQEMIKQLQEKYDRAKSVAFINFDKLTVHENESLRRELESEGGEYVVPKKTLLDRALKEKNAEGFTSAKNFEGKIAIVFGYDDEVAPAKIIDKFQKQTNDKVTFVGGILEGKFLEPVQMGELAKVPDKQELYAKLVGSLNSPISGFANVLAGNLRSLAYVLKAIEEKKA